MQSRPDTLRQRIEQFRATLKQSGVRLTHQRMTIFREVARLEDHPDAESVYKRVRKNMPMVSLDTVYRTLWLLQDLGVIRALGVRDRVRFDGNAQPHHHFVCRVCGSMSDFYSSEYDRLRIPKAAKALGNTETAQVEVQGICIKCSRKSNLLKGALRAKERK